VFTIKKFFTTAYQKHLLFFDRAGRRAINVLFEKVFKSYNRKIIQTHYQIQLAIAYNENETNNSI
jgi:hypothetical protein